MTRAQPGADATAERLRERGLVALVEPLFALVSLPATPPEDFAALAFTSANGVRAFAALSAARDRPAFCVGDATAAAAKAVGYLDVRSAGGDVDALLALLLAAPATGTIVHAGNEDSRGDLVGRLNVAGRPAAFVPLFRAAPAPNPGVELAAHLAGDPRFEGVLIHSPRGAERLADLARAAAHRAPLPVAAISQACADELGTIASRIEIAHAPNEAGLLSALDRLLAQA